MYAWHVTFADQPAVQRLAGRYQAALAGLPGLDFVPLRWLHLTTQGVGFTDEVSDSDIGAIAAAARDRLATAGPVGVTIGPARVTPEAVLLEVTPVAELGAVRSGLRAAIGDVWPPGQIPETDEWMPHVSVAYSSTTASAQPYTAALAGRSFSAECLIEAVQLIVLGRDRRSYEWAVHDTVRLSLHSARQDSRQPYL